MKRQQKDPAWGQACGKSRMDYLEHCIDLRRSECDPELFAIALALHQIQTLIERGGSASGRPGDDSSLYPQHLEESLQVLWKRREKPAVCLGMAAITAAASTREGSVGEWTILIP
jgi:hypothetical protein